MVDRPAADAGPAGNDNQRRIRPDITSARRFRHGARKPAPIALEPEDFMARAICCEALIDRFKLHLTAPDEDAAENEPGCSIRDAELTSAIDAHLGDLRSDITRTLEQIAERIRDDRYNGCPRSPFYRRRGP
jgi:hypothetical protein